MQTNFKVTNPDDIIMELTIEMPLKQWKILKDQLSDNWPSWDLGSKISDMIIRANKHFYPEDKP